MKTLKWSLLVVLVTGVGFSTVMLLTRSPRPLDLDADGATEATEPTQAVDRNEVVVYQSAPAATAPARELPPAIPLTPDETAVPAADITSEPVKVVRVRADQVLAKVNDQAVLLKDLVPLRADEQEQAMTLEEYESRLNRAIELELTLEAAAARGVDLTPEQARRVNAVARRHDTALQEYRKQGITWSSVTPEQVEFEQRVTSALLLQQNLVAIKAYLAPASDPGVQARYEQALSEVLTWLKSQAAVRRSSSAM